MTVENRNRIEDYRPPPFPDDFGERLEGLKKLTGLSWGAFADLLGVTERTVQKWLGGGKPSGGSYWGMALTVGFRCKAVVTGHEEIEIPVTVVIEKGGRRAEGVLVDARFRCNVGEGAVRVVAE